MEKTILDFIILSLALKVFRRDQKAFKDFKMWNLYLDKLDAVINQLQQDFNNVKKELITKYHIDVRYLDKKNNVVRYICKKNNEPGIVELHLKNFGI